MSHCLLFAMPDFQCSSLQAMQGPYAAFSLYNVEFAFRNKKAWYHIFFSFSSMHDKIGKYVSVVSDFSIGGSLGMALWLSG